MSEKLSYIDCKPSYDKGYSVDLGGEQKKKKRETPRGFLRLREKYEDLKRVNIEAQKVIKAYEDKLEIYHHSLTSICHGVEDPAGEARHALRCGSMTKRV